MPKNSSSTLENGALLATLAGAVLLFWGHSRQPYSEPSRTVQNFFKSCSAKDLKGFQVGSTPAFYGAFVRFFGDQRYRRVKAIYERIFQLGEAKWDEYRNRADVLAQAAYQALREKVNSLGRQAFEKLPVEERMRLMDDPAKYGAFLVDQGVRALPPDEQKRIPSSDDFRQGRDRQSFLDREGWGLLSAEDRAALGSAAALSRTETPERTAFIDKMGLSQLDQKLKAELAGTERRELSDRDSFTFRYGEPLASAFLASNKIPEAAVGKPCSFEREDQEGSLLKGDLSRCVVSAPAGERLHVFQITLKKVGFRWLVEDVQPALYSVGW